jgi:hypothetical protein
LPARLLSLAATAIIFALNLAMSGLVIALLLLGRRPARG